MDTFSEALLSGTTNKIPESFDWFAPLLGDWDCDYYDEYVKGEKRHVKGEWIFRRVLEGTGIQERRRQTCRQGFRRREHLLDILRHN